MHRARSTGWTEGSARSIPGKGRTPVHLPAFGPDAQYGCTALVPRAAPVQGSPRGVWWAKRASSPTSAGLFAFFVLEMLGQVLNPGTAESLSRMAPNNDIKLRVIPWMDNHQCGSRTVCTSPPVLTAAGARGRHAESSALLTLHGPHASRSLGVTIRTLCLTKSAPVRQVQTISKLYTRLDFVLAV